MTTSPIASAGKMQKSFQGRTLTRGIMHTIVKDRNSFCASAKTLAVEFCSKVSLEEGFARMDFTAIDFETANQRRDSACQLAAVVVRGGQIVERQMWLIRPKPFYFSPRNIDVHGIRPEDVAQEAEFGELWHEIAPYLQAGCLIAHNAPFDIGVLTGCLTAHRKTVPNLQFTCTRLIARAAWPGQPGYGLKRLADWLGIQFRHHDALEDSVACGRILLAAAATVGATTLEQLESKLKLLRGFVNHEGYHGAKKVARARRANQPSSVSKSAIGSSLSGPTPGQVVRCDQAEYHVSGPVIDLQRLLIRADFLRRLVGKQVVITGRFKTLSRENAELLARRLGALLQDSVTLSTNIVVVGELEEQTSGTEQLHNHKEQEARKLASQGHPIRLMNEMDFIGLVQHLDA